MARRLPLLVLIAVTLLIAYSAHAQTTSTTQPTARSASIQSAAPDTVYDTVIVTAAVAIKVLEERIASVKDGLANEATERRENKSDTRVEMAIYATMFGLILAVVGWLGKKYLDQVARDRVDETIAPELKRRWEELSSEVERQMGEIRKLDDDELRRLRMELKDISIRVPEEVSARFAELEERSRAEKAQEEWSAEDWFFKGRSESDHGDTRAAIKSYTRSIKLMEEASLGSGASNRYSEMLVIAYLNRGNRLTIKGDRAMAVSDFSKAIELAPEYFMPHLSKAEAHVLMREFRPALAAATDAMSRAPDKGGRVISHYLKWICELLLDEDKDAAKTMKLLDAMLEYDFESPWRFEEIESWLKTAEIIDEKRKSIINMTKRLKARHTMTMPVYFH